VSEQATAFGPPRTVVSSIYEIEPSVLEEIAQWLEMRGLRISLGQLVGLQGLKSSFVRAFGPDTATTIPASTWTRIQLLPAGEPWRQFGEVCWESVPTSGDPDSASYAGCIRCLKEGIYDLVGGVIFDSSNQTGDRAISVSEERGPYAGAWDLVTSMPMPKVATGGVLVGGETYQYLGNIVSLRAWASVATATTAVPQSEWLSATFIGRP
jgi:hypothetical protein